MNVSCVISWSKVSQVERRPYKNTCHQVFEYLDKKWTLSRHRQNMVMMKTNQNVLGTCTAVAWLFKQDGNTFNRLISLMVGDEKSWNPVFPLHRIRIDSVTVVVVVYMSVSNGYASCVFRWSCRSAPNRGRAGLVRTNFQWFNLRIGPKTLLPDFMSLSLPQKGKL